MRKAKWLYTINVVTFFRPSVISQRKKQPYYATNRAAMLSNYLTIAFRTLRKNRAFSLINISGLAIGMAACTLILQYVSFELSYDDFREPTLYRLVEYGYQHGELVVSERRPPPP